MFQIKLITSIEIIAINGVIKKGMERRRNTSKYSNNLKHQGNLSFRRKREIGVVTNKLRTSRVKTKVDRILRGTTL